MHFPLHTVPYFDYSSPDYLSYSLQIGRKGPWVIILLFLSRLTTSPYALSPLVS